MGMGIKLGRIKFLGPTGATHLKSEYELSQNHRCQRSRSQQSRLRSRAEVSRAEVSRAEVESKYA